MSEIAAAEGVVPACTLAVLWALEGVAPALHGPRAGLAQRARHLVLGLVNATLGLAIAAIMLAAHRALEQTGFGTLRWLPLHFWSRALVALILLDLWGYTCHVLMHRVPVLWRVHAVHHHADRLEATVAMRFHAVEILLQGVSTMALVSVLGLGIEHVALYNLVLLPVSLFHHSDVRVPRRLDRALRLVIVTPSLHWLHHSRWQPETDSNYSPVLSVWDRLFGTFRTRSKPEAVELGLDGFSRDEVSTVRGMLATPFSASRSGMGRPPFPPPVRARPRGRFPRAGCNQIRSGRSKRAKEVRIMNESKLNALYIPLRLCYGLVPIVAGADKFTNLLTDWSQYLPGQVSGVLPFGAETFMMIVGVIEIVAGLAVLTMLTRLGSYVVAAWLVLISLNVLLAGHYDIAVRDLVMALGAYTLGGVAALRGEGLFPTSDERGTTTLASTGS